MRGDRVEIVIDAGSGTTRTYDVVATRAGRKVNVTHGRGVVEVARSPAAAARCAPRGSSPTASSRSSSTRPPTTRWPTRSPPPSARSDAGHTGDCRSPTSPRNAGGPARTGARAAVPTARPTDPTSPTVRHRTGAATPVRARRSRSTADRAGPRPSGRRPARPAHPADRRARPGGAGARPPTARRASARAAIDRRPADAGPTPTFADATGEVAALAERLPALTLADEHRLARRLATAARTRDGQARATALAAVAAAVDAAEQRVAARRAAVPAITYPRQLPVSARRDDIAAAIRDHQVVIVAGETGSGKTTQIPKICLELGRGVAGMIGHTQPRRLAARTVADRIAEELGTELGRRRRLQGPLHRPGRREHAGQAHDRRHPARRAGRRPHPLAATTP